MAYIPQPVQRFYIPKPGSDKQRPFGIPALEDKLVQAGLSKILQTVYEADFVEDSYGFRSGRNCHDALRELGRTLERQSTQYIVEADIKGFFDHVDQEQLMVFLAYRVANKRVHRYIKRFLKAGIQEDGSWQASERGTPQGGVISPLLATSTSTTRWASGLSGDLDRAARSRPDSSAMRMITWPVSSTKRMPNATASKWNGASDASDSNSPRKRPRAWRLGQRRSNVQKSKERERPRPSTFLASPTTAPPRGPASGFELDARRSADA